MYDDLKETLAYYNSNNSVAFCTFLDATKAFDRVRYCKLFRLLVDRGLPACVIQMLICCYTGYTSCSMPGMEYSRNILRLPMGQARGSTKSNTLLAIY